MDINTLTKANDINRLHMVIRGLLDRMNMNDSIAIININQHSNREEFRLPLKDPSNAQWRRELHDMLLRWDEELMNQFKKL